MPLRLRIEASVDYGLIRYFNRFRRLIGVCRGYFADVLCERAQPVFCGPNKTTLNLLNSQGRQFWKWVAIPRLWFPPRFAQNILNCIPVLTPPKNPYLIKTPPAMPTTALPTGPPAIISSSSWASSVFTSYRINAFCAVSLKSMTCF